MYLLACLEVEIMKNSRCRHKDYIQDTMSENVTRNSLLLFPEKAKRWIYCSLQQAGFSVQFDLSQAYEFCWFIGFEASICFHHPYFGSC